MWELEFKNDGLGLLAKCQKCCLRFFFFFLQIIVKCKKRDKYREELLNKKVELDDFKVIGISRWQKMLEVIKGKSGFSHTKCLSRG